MLYRDNKNDVVPSALNMCPVAPDQVQACEPCSFCEDDSLNRGCSDRGICKDGVCDCANPWLGRICLVNKEQCPSGVKDKRGECCPSGVLSKQNSSMRGLCCPKAGNITPITDATGTCCDAGAVDACGVCGGMGFALDVAGVCCKARHLFACLSQC